MGGRKQIKTSLAAWKFNYVREPRVVRSATSIISIALRALSRPRQFLYINDVSITGRVFQ